MRMLTVGAPGFLWSILFSRFRTRLLGHLIRLRSLLLGHLGKLRVLLKRLLNNLYAGILGHRLRLPVLLRRLQFSHLLGLPGLLLHLHLLFGHLLGLELLLLDLLLLHVLLLLDHHGIHLRILLGEAVGLSPHYAGYEGGLGGQRNRACLHQHVFQKDDAVL